jgi:HYR domain-containing protein
MNRLCCSFFGLACTLAFLTAPLASATISAIPALRVDGSTTEATGPNGATASYTVKADDSSTGPLPATCDIPAGTAGVGDFTVTAQFPLGTTVVTCQTTDSTGKLWTRSDDVVVKDTTPPSIGPTASITTGTRDPAGTTVHYDIPTATDVVDGTDPVTCTPATDTNFSVGATTVTCTSTDAHQNTATSTFTVTVVIADTTPPVVTVPADTTVNTDSASGTTVTYTASATDNVDGPLTPSCNPSSGSIFPIGTTTVTCSATDAHANTGTGSFTITVVLVDTTPPNVTVPGSMTVEATSASGAAVVFAATASDNLDGSVTPTCKPSSGETFSFGTTTVTCSATDSHGNIGTASFSVTVIDSTPPSFQDVPPDMKVEANGPGGSAVSYSAPTATDTIDGPIALVTCAPASGSLFALGLTRVTCSATDSHGNTGAASFTVQVVDTTPPHLVIPGDGYAYASSAAGAAVSDPAIAGWLASASASDLVDPHPAVTNDAPTVLPVGTTPVTFVAHDASGNSASATAKITVKPQATPGTTPPPLPPPPDRQPPDDVGSLAATAGDGIVTLTWKRPAAPDFAFVVITRSTATSVDSQVVYRGSATSFADHGVTDGVQYRYIVLAFDEAGNSSGGVAVAATPKRSALLSPKDGAQLKKPPRLAWLPVPNARYYNVQLFKETTKILSVWPTKTTLALHARWTYQDIRYRLTPGIYHWYVWPGFGSRADRNYGAMLGSSSFVIVG